MPRLPPIATAAATSPRRCRCWPGSTVRCPLPGCSSPLLTVTFPVHAAPPGDLVQGMAESAPPAAGPTANQGPFACRLALKLIEEKLGTICRQVMACLVEHGTQQVMAGWVQAACLAAGHMPCPACGCLVIERRTLLSATKQATTKPAALPLPRARPRSCLQYGEIQRVCKDLPPATLRQALLVLIQHNYVACYLREEAATLRGPGPQYQLYEAALPRILQSLR